jgi:uncharacterized protein (DUF305 family)
MATENERMDHSKDGDHGSHGMGMYLRFGAMILTAMVVMYWTMFVSSWELEHVRWSQSRMFMALTMGGTMGLIMRAMIPHHSMAITRSERAGIEDVRVCELAVEISEAQRREILEMDWLIDDIERNGVASTAEEAQTRPVPDYEEPADRHCPTG